MELLINLAAIIALVASGAYFLVRLQGGRGERKFKR